MWVCYNAYMTLNKWFCGFYIFLMFQAPISGIFSTLKLSGDSFFKPIVYTGQLGFYAYFGVYKYTGLFRKWIKAKNEAMKKVEDAKWAELKRQVL